MNSKPNIKFGMHIFRQNTGEVTMSGDTDKINGFTRCTIRQLLLGVHTSKKIPGELKRAYTFAAVPQKKQRLVTINEG
jgi:hypothetical protein